MEKLKIAELAPIAWRVPPKNYGPWEQVVSTITEGLVKLGHDVTLFATADSQTQAKLVAVAPHPYNEVPNMNVRLYEFWHDSTCYEMADQFDLIHNHFDFPPLTYSRLVKTPTVTTVHGFDNKEIINLYRKYKDNYYISISYADRRHAPDLNWIGNVYHGLKLEQFDYNDKPQDYLLFLGRISEEKGVHSAIDVAKKTNRELVISGIVPDEDKKYFEAKIEPQIDNKQIKFVGPAGPKKRNRLFRNAYASLHLVEFDEPFGLTLIEAMATGTPVIAINRGSIPEVIEDGKTGFVVANTQEASQEVSEISKISRADCRKRVEENFTIEVMVENYIKIFEKILEIEKKKE